MCSSVIWIQLAAEVVNMHRIRAASDGPINFMQIKANRKGISCLWLREAKLVLVPPFLLN